MKETFECLGVKKETSKKGNEYDALHVRHTIINDDGVVTQLMTGKVFPKRDVDYEEGELLRPSFTLAVTPTGFLQPAELTFVPTND